LIVGAVAIFVKIRRRKNNLHAVESQEEAGMEIREVSPATQDDLQDAEEGVEIAIS
jgi:hypothetical protein